MTDRDFIRQDNNYRTLKAFQKAECVYDVTYYFANRFLQKGDRNMRAQTIIDEIITMTGRLGITSLTEGVETKEQFDSLKEMGCRLFQGYYFAKPMPLEDFERYLADSGRQT